MQNLKRQDLDVFDIKEKSWEKITTDNSPPSRFGHSAILLSNMKEIMVFGGKSSCKKKKKRNVLNNFFFFKKILGASKNIY